MTSTTSRRCCGAVERALARIVAGSTSLLPLLIVGAPLQVAGGVFNAGVVIHGGRVLGVVPKSYLPEYREYYEKRQFRAARDAVHEEVELLGERVPFGSDLLFSARDLEGLVVHVEMCEDLWVPIPPSSYGALAARPCSPTSRRATSRWPRPTTATCSWHRSRAARSPPTSIRPRGSGSPPPTWPGMGKPRSSRTGSCLPRRSASQTRRSSSWRTSTWIGYCKTGLV